MIANGCIADATDVITAFKNSYQLVAVNTGERAIQTWTYDCNGPSYNPTCIKGCTFCCGSAGNLGVYDMDVTRCCCYGFILCQTNFTDCFGTTGMYCTTTNGTYFGCVYQQCITNAYICVCSAGNLSLFACGTYEGVSSQPNCIYVEQTRRTFTDCYRICFSNCLCVFASCHGGCYSPGYHPARSTISFGSCDLFCQQVCICAGNCNCCFGTACQPDTLFEFRRVPHTDSCYCFLCNSVLQCCIDTLCCPLRISIYAPDASSFGTDLGYAIACMNLKEVSNCYITNRKYIKSNALNFGYAPNYLLVACCRSDSGSDLLRWDLFTPDKACCLAGPFCFGQVVSVGSYGLCCYSIAMYNNCTPNNCDSCPVCLGGYAAQGIYFNG